VTYTFFEPTSNEFVEGLTWECEAEDTLHAINQLLDAERSNGYRVAVIESVETA
jgi:hypothetical protein